jgi:hypothetical protein
MFGTILKNITVFETVRRRLGLERDNIKDMETLGNVFTGDKVFLIRSTLHVHWSLV